MQDGVFSNTIGATWLSKIWRLGHSPNARVLPEGIQNRGGS